MSPAQDCASVAAHVVNSDGTTQSDASVELLSLEDGSTEMLNTGFGDAGKCVKPGWYRITAEYGMINSSQDVQLAPGMQTVTLRIDTGKATEGGGTVSATSMLVPAKAAKALRKASELIANSHYDQALSFVAKAISIYPQSSEAYELRGLVSLLEHQNQRAIRDFQQSIALDANNANSRVMMGAAFNEIREFQKALAALQAAVPLAPNSWQENYELGRAYAGLGKLPEALRALTCAIQLNPTFAPLRLARGIVMVRARHYSDATTDLSAFLQHTPSGPDTQIAQQFLALAKAGQR